MTPANVFIIHIGQDGACSSYDPNQPCHTGALVQFYVGTFGCNYYCGPHTFTWDFGDGTTSTSLNTFHTFVSAGTYDISVVIRNAFQQLTLTERVIVTGDIFERRPADFSANVNGHSALFKIDRGDSGITSWTLDFGDGTFKYFDHTDGRHDFAIAHEVVIVPTPRSRGVRH